MIKNNKFTKCHICHMQCIRKEMHHGTEQKPQQKPQALIENKSERPKSLNFRHNHRMIDRKVLLHEVFEMEVITVDVYFNRSEKVNWQFVMMVIKLCSSFSSNTIFSETKTDYENAQCARLNALRDAHDVYTSHISSYIRYKR